MRRRLPPFDRHHFLLCYTGHRPFANDGEGAHDTPLGLHTDITRSPLHRSHFLHSSYRHASDPIYCEFLNTIRCTRVDQPYINKILSHTYINESEVQQHLGSDTVILCTHRHRAHAYNSAAMRHIYSEAEVVELKVHVPNSPIDMSPTENKWFHTWASDVDFHQLPYIAIGAKVMITSNMDALDHGVNGDMGYIQSWGRNAHGLINYVDVLISRNNRQVRFRRTQYKSVHHNGRRFTKSTFPLALAYAITGHKSQGATLNTRTILHIDGAFAPGLVYVMLSRITQRLYLKIVNGLKAADIVPMPRYILQWMQCLEP